MTDPLKEAVVRDIAFYFKGVIKRDRASRQAAPDRRASPAQIIGSPCEIERAVFPYVDMRCRFRVESSEGILIFSSQDRRMALKIGECVVIGATCPFADGRITIEPKVPRLAERLKASSDLVVVIVVCLPIIVIGVEAPNARCGQIATAEARIAGWLSIIEHMDATVEEKDPIVPVVVRGEEAFCGRVAFIIANTVWLDMSNSDAHGSCALAAICLIIGIFCLTM